MSSKTWQPRTVGDVHQVVTVAIFETSDTLRNALRFIEQYAADNGNEESRFAVKLRAELTRRGESF